MLQPLLAAAPILAILLLMMLRGWPAWQAGLAGLALTVPISLLAFAAPAGGGATMLAGAGAEAAFTAATILWIIFPALCLFELLARRGAFEALKSVLAGMTADPRLIALLVAWFFALFLEGAAGFGTPVALAAPILVSLGFAPLRALTVVLVGHAAGVSFGAIGTPVFAQAEITGLGLGEIAGPTALLHACLGIILTVAVYRLAAPDGTRGIALAGYGWPVMAAVAFLVPFGLIAATAGPELPTFAGALVGGGLFLLAVHLFQKAGSTAPHAAGGPAFILLLNAAVPYGVIVLLILATRLIPEAREVVQAVTWGWSLGSAYGGTFQPLYHPGTLLMAGFIGGGLLMGCNAPELREAAVRAALRLTGVVLALVAMLAVARLMVHSGMIASLADFAAAVAGPAWPLFAPLAGVLGSFVTGSATASNILFTDFQVRAAQSVGMAAVLGAAAQGFGAAIGNMVCPHNIIAGAATVGLVGREGEVLRRTAVICLAYTLAGGIVLMLLVRVSGLEF